MRKRREKVSVKAAAIILGAALLTAGQRRTEEKCGKRSS